MPSLGMNDKFIKHEFKSCCLDSLHIGPCWQPLWWGSYINKVHKSYNFKQPIVSLKHFII
jgi:hypothetical protein